MKSLKSMSKRELEEWLDKTKDDPAEEVDFEAENRKRMGYGFVAKGPQIKPPPARA